MKSGYYWDWKGVQSWSWLPSASEEWWKLITNVIFDICGTSGKSWSEYLKSGYADPLAFISLFACGFLVCVHAHMGFVCRFSYFWVCQFDFLFQHAIIVCGMFPHLEQPHNTQSGNTHKYPQKLSKYPDKGIRLYLWEGDVLRNNLMIICINYQS